MNGGLFFLGVWCSNGGESIYFTCCANKLMIPIVGSRTPDWSRQSSPLISSARAKHVSSGSLCFFLIYTNFCFRGSKRRNLSIWMKLCQNETWPFFFCVCQSSIYSKAPAFILADLWVLIMYLKNKNEFYEKFWWWVFGRCFSPLTAKQRKWAAWLRWKVRVLHIL